jgi:hypothetical protein
MLPGGMGYRLERSKKKYPGPFDVYDVVWIDFDITQEESDMPYQNCVEAAEKFFASRNF